MTLASGVSYDPVINLTGEDAGPPNLEFTVA